MNEDAPTGPQTPGQKAAATKLDKYGRDGLSEISRRAHTTGRWNRYLEDVRRYVASDLLDSQEIEYKLAIERQLQEARRAVLEGDENCLALVTKAVNNNLTSTYDKIGLRNWFRDQPEEAQEALRAIWTDAEGLSVADRIRAFTRLIPDSLQSGTGTRLRWISVLLMACGARRFPPYKVTEFNKTYERTGHSGPAAGGDEASHYETALGFLDQLLERAREAGMERPKDRLEAQSVAWAVAYESPAPPNNGDQRPCWFVGASFGEGTEDQTARFVRESIWEHGGAKSDLFLDQVKLIEPGDQRSRAGLRPLSPRLVSRTLRRAAIGGEPVPCARRPGAGEALG